MQLCTWRACRVSPRRFQGFRVRFLGSVADCVVLRPYQEHCLDACMYALDTGSSRIGISLPTGSGKTTVFICLLSRLSHPAQNSDATRSLIVVNSIELARQSANQVTRLFPDWSVEIEQGTKHRASGFADVTVATIQTLKNPDRMSKFDPRKLKAIIVDEAHHAAAPSYRQLLSHFHADIKHPEPEFKPPELHYNVPIIGFSATFSRHDGLALGSVFEKIVYHRDFLEMIKEQWLCGVRFTSVKADIDLSGVVINSRTGEFNPTSLAQVINTDTINNLVVKAWIERASTRKSTLVFCVNVAHVHSLTQRFRSYGIDARYIYSNTPQTERKALVSSFKAGQFPVLVNCAILTEGADIPNIDCVLIARPTRSRNVFAQMIGRGMRLSPETDKIDCRIIDFVDSMTRVSGVISTPTLFGLDPTEITIDDEDLESLEKRVSDLTVTDTTDNVPNPTSVTFIDHENPFLVEHGTSGSPYIGKLSRLAWVGCGDDIYILECFNKGHIRIEPVKDTEDAITHYVARFNPAAIDKETATTLSVSPYFRSRPLLTTQLLPEAVRGCDTYVEKTMMKGLPIQTLYRSARWRQTPASEGQKAIITKRWGKTRIGSVEMPTEEARLEKIERLSKGEAADIITRIKHGAQMRFEKKEKSNRKTQIAILNETTHRLRGIVRVGPLSS